MTRDRRLATFADIAARLNRLRAGSRSGCVIRVERGCPMEPMSAVIGVLLGAAVGFFFERIRRGSAYQDRDQILERGLQCCIPKIEPGKTGKQPAAQPFKQYPDTNKT